VPINYTLSNSTKDSNKTIKAFLSNFVSDDFFIEVVSCCVYPSDFGVSSVGNNQSIVDYLRSFLVDLEKTVNNLKVANITHLKNNIKMTRTILNVREYGSTILTINNVQNHLPNLDVPQQKLLSTIQQNPVSDNKTFSLLLDKIIHNIQIYYEVCSISYGLFEFDNFTDYAMSNNVSAYEATKLYKEKVIQLYNDLNKLQSLNKSENEKDFFIINSEQSVKELSENIVNYIETGYSSFTTGFDLIDNNLDGLESASLYMISAPSNHGKSIFMANILHQLIRGNLQDFDPNDGVIFITLEDDIKKLLRRLCSIFGNYKSEVIKRMYVQGHQCIKNNNNDNNIKHRFTDIMSGVIKHSIYTKTKDKVQLIVKHCNENVFSAGDLSKFIDTIRVESGVNIKMVIIDYLDVMTPTVHNSGGDTYLNQGTITQELRSLTRIHKLPILTATQNKRGSENVQYRQSTVDIGDSHLKLRYSDYWIMNRMDSSKDPFTPIVQKYCFNQNHYTGKDQIDPQILKLKDQICEDLIPFDSEIVKSKDGGKGVQRFMLFCKHNLRIYDNIQQYLDDINTLNTNSKRLNDDLDILTDMSVSSVGDDYEDIFGTDQSTDNVDSPINGDTPEELTQIIQSNINM